MTAKETYQLLRSKKASSNEQLLNQLQVYTKDQVAMDYSTDIRELSASSGKLSGTGGIKTFITGRDKLTYDFIDLDLYYIKDEVDELIEEEKKEREEADADLQKQLDEEKKEREEADADLQKQLDDETDWAKGSFVYSISASGDDPLTLEATPGTNSDGYKTYSITGSVNCYSKEESYSKDEIDDKLKDVEGKIPSDTGVSSVKAESGSKILVVNSPDGAASGDVTVEYSVDEDALEEWLNDNGFNPGGVDTGVTSVIAKNLGEDDDTQAILKLSPLTRDDSDATGAATIGIGVDKAALNTWINNNIDINTGVTSIEITSGTLTVNPTGEQNGKVSINLEYTGGEPGSGAVDSVLIQHLEGDDTEILTIAPTSAQTSDVVFSLGIDEDALKEYITGTVNLSNYYTKSEVDKLLEDLAIGDVDLSDYVKIGDICPRGVGTAETYLISSISSINEEHNVKIDIYMPTPPPAPCDEDDECTPVLWAKEYVISADVDLDDYYTSEEIDELLSKIGPGTTYKYYSEDTVDTTTNYPSAQISCELDDNSVLFQILAGPTDNSNTYLSATASSGSSSEKTKKTIKLDPTGFYYDECEVATQCWVSDNYYTKQEVRDLIAQAQIDPTTVDLSDYYTKSQVDNLLSNYVKIEDLSGEYVKTIVGTPPEDDEYTFDTNLAFVAVVASENPQPPDGSVIQGLTYQIGAYVYLPGYYTKTEVDELIENITPVDLSGYVKKTDLCNLSESYYVSSVSADNTSRNVQIYVDFDPSPHTDTEDSIWGNVYKISASVDLTDYVKISDLCPRDSETVKSYLIGGFSTTTNNSHNVELTFTSDAPPFPPCDEDEDVCPTELWAPTYTVLGNVDLSDYYTKEEVRELIAEAQWGGGDVDLSDYVKISELRGNFVSSLNVSNDQNVTLTLTTTPPAPDDELQGTNYWISASVNLSDYYTKEEVDELLSDVGGGTTYKYYTETGNSAIIETPDLGYGTISTTWLGGNSLTMTITTDSGNTVMRGNYIHVTGSSSASGSITIDGKEVLTEADFSKDDISKLLEYYDYNNSIAESINDTNSNVHILEVNGSGNTSYFTLAGSKIPVGREMYWIIHNTGTKTHTYQFGYSSNYHHICVDGNDTLTIQPGEYGEFSMISDGTNGYIRSASQS